MLMQYMHFNIQDATISTVLLSGKCTNVSDLTGRGFEGNNWDVSTCGQAALKEDRKEGYSETSG